jgi:alcohol dehydrogenase class IV
MPRPLTAAVGVDTLTHGIEAYVSRLATPMTDPIALQCIRLCGEHLERAWNEPGSRPAREGMMLAATLGGMAFANSSVALVHGMSRPIGALFHVPHGVSNAMLLAVVTRFSAAGAAARYAAVARALAWARPGDGDTAAVDALLTGLDGLNRRLEIPRLRDFPGMDATRFERSLETMAADALASGSPQNNPVVPPADRIVALYREAW